MSHQELMNNLALAAIRYAGPCSDPWVGWLGRPTSSPDVFRCERCRAEHTNSDLIAHEADCPAAALIAAMKAVEGYEL